MTAGLLRRLGGPGLWTLLARLTCMAAGDAKTHYGIVFDAGSSGSRIHVYTWRSGGGAGDFELLSDDLVKTKPGLSSFAAEASGAGKSLLPLLDHAKTRIPQEHWAVTPVLLMASAGLRLIDEAASAAILTSVADTLAASPFLFEHSWAYIMPGSDEALFGWVAVNYLLGTLSGEAGAGTSGAIDLGGGSVQLVYSVPAGVLLPEEYAAAFSFAGSSHRLYMRSHLGFGLDEARKRVASLLEAANATEHPCHPAGHAADSEALVGAGSYKECAKLYERLFNKSRCELPPCSFAGAFQPALPSSLFGFSYLYDRTSAIGLLGGAPQVFGVHTMSLEEVQRAAEALCAAPAAATRRRFEGGEDGEKWANFCGDAAYVVVLLGHGFGIDAATRLTMGNKVGGVELVWTLGAIIDKFASLQTASSTRRSSEL